jgi:hypothetical protein
MAATEDARNVLVNRSIAAVWAHPGPVPRWWAPLAFLRWLEIYRVWDVGLWRRQVEASDAYQDAAELAICAKMDGPDLRRGG